MDRDRVCVEVCTQIVTERSISKANNYKHPQRNIQAKHTPNVIAPLKIQIHSQQCFWLVFLNIPTH